jgi:outer membrane immunogenic protein
MRNVATYCVGVLCTVAIMHPAVAAEIPATPKRERVAERPAPQRPAPRPAPTQGANWTGGQLGGSNGVSSVNNSFVDPGSFICPFGSTFNSNCFETPFAFSGQKTTYVVGPFMGYRAQFGMWVAGVEGDWNWKNAEVSGNQSSASAIVVPPSGFFGSPSTFLRTDQFAGSVKQKWDASIRGRLGMLVTPWSMVYVTGGVAFAEISGSFAYKGALFSCPFGVSASVSSCASSFTPSIATTATAVTWSDTRVGSTVGAGWESELWAGVKWRAEYRYTDFGSYTKTVPSVTACTGSSAAPSSCTSTPSTGATLALRSFDHRFTVGLGIELGSIFGPAY